MKGVSTKRGPYQQYNPDIRAKIGKDVSHHGVSAASCQFTTKLDKLISKSTVHVHMYIQFMKHTWRQ